MSVWERHRNIFIVGTSFILLVAVTWLFFVRGYAEEAGQERKAFDKKYKKEADVRCPKNKGRPVKQLQQRYSTLDKRLDGEIDRLGEHLMFNFPDPIVPANYLKDSGIYVRRQHNTLKEDVGRMLSARDIYLDEAASDLGFVLSSDLSESFDFNVTVLKQMEVVRRVFNTLENIHVGPDERFGVDVPRILMISMVKADVPVEAGVTGETFIKEYPVHLELYITLPGLMKFLELSSEPNSFHIIKSLKVDSRPVSRESVLRKKIIDRNEELLWYGHYYRVRMVVASMTMLEKKDINQVMQHKAEVKKPATKWKPKPH